jgi:hypothetical protein
MSSALCVNTDEAKATTTSYECWYIRTESAIVEDYYLEALLPSVYGTFWINFSK